MKRIIIFFTLLFFSQIIITSAFYENSNLEYTLNCDQITFFKHIIDDNFGWPHDVYTCDLDNDGDIDFIGAGFIDGDIAWWCNDGGVPIVWTKQIIDPFFNGPASVYANDVDGDGDLDVLGAAFLGNQIAWWQNNGGNPINWKKYVLKNGFLWAHDIYSCDFDYDGDMDVFAASWNLDKIIWLRNDGGDPVSFVEDTIVDNFDGATSVRVADIDGDGLLDVIGSAFDADKISWFWNNNENPNNWNNYNIDDNINGAHRFEVYDMDNDGDVDILGAAFDGNELAWWRNDGGYPISWTKQTIISNFAHACIGFPVDLDDDGDMDVLGTAQIEDEVCWWRNDGDNPIIWTKFVIESGFDGAFPCCANDFDGDGDFDVLAGASFSNEMVWWENQLYSNPEKPLIPVGPNSGKTGLEYIYSCITEDPDGDDLFYLFDWGDESDSGWIGPFNSGEECSASHTWTEKGSFEIKVKAKDIHGGESEWSDPLVVGMPKNKQSINPTFLQFLDKFLERFPLLFLLLQFQSFNKLIYNLEIKNEEINDKVE